MLTTSEAAKMMGSAMARRMLMRDVSGEHLIAESELPLEKNLHDVLTQHPALLPDEDLSLGQLVVVGRESSLTSGYADLVLVDDRGQLCLVEVKKAGNPDTRQVVAQLLDYAAALWGQTLAQFEKGVVMPYLDGLHDNDAEDLAAYLASAFDDPETGEERAPAIVQRLEQTLETGDFTLVVAAPHVPLGVQRVLEYLNARGQRFYGLEVSYFKGPPDCFVPRLVVMPPAAGPSGGGASAPPLERASFLEEVPDHVQADVSEFLDSAQAAGADVVWQSYGPSIKVAREKTRQVAYLETRRLGVTIQASGGFPEEPFSNVAQRLTHLGLGEAKDWWHIVRWSELKQEEAAQALAAVLDLIAELVPTSTWEPLPTVRMVEFDRNDNNIWVKSVPELSDLQGVRLRGKLTRVDVNDDAEAELVPLKGSAAGWRPRGLTRPTGDFWPANVYDGHYALRVDARAIDNSAPAV
jgi:hypothetical protein